MKTSTSRRWLQCVRAALLAFAVLGVPIASSAAVYVSVAIAPPPLPVYVQPVCPGPGYIWIPGYWAYGPAGYYWVRGEWVLAPFVGALWTPGYWGWSNGLYVWHVGYWGTRVGFYGGINYGFGYNGYGYEGGYWRGNAFYYNLAANNVSTTVVHTTYRRAINNVATGRASYNGGAGGMRARPTAAQLAQQPHTAMTTTQLRREQTAANGRGNERAAIATPPQPGALSRQAGTQVRAATVHNAPTRAARVQSPPERNAATHAARAQAAAPERSAPTQVQRMQPGPVRTPPTRMAGTQMAPPQHVQPHAAPPRSSASASIAPVRPHGEHPHA